MHDTEGLAIQVVVSILSKDDVNVHTYLGKSTTRAILFRNIRDLSRILK
jgi:hypothetical protein